MGGIYLHIPFCKQACTYCDFYFSISRKHEAAFRNALRKELVLQAPQWREHLNPVETIYFGGGTPSLLPAEEIAALVALIRSAYPVAPAAEITLEANPDDLSADYLHGLRCAGVNRLSIGLQSLYPEELQWMNRAHTAREARTVVQRARNAGFLNFSVDLIFHTPYLDSAKWQQLLQEVLAWRVPHLSCYGLTVEPRTVLERRVNSGQLPAPPAAAFSQQFDQLMDASQAAGYHHYEISNYALPGYRSRHNSAYWNGVPYLGVGPSAHSFDGARRYCNLPKLVPYCDALLQNQLPPCEPELLTPVQQFNEYVLTRLRTAEGIVTAQVEALFPSAKLKRQWWHALRKQQEAGLLQATDGGFSLTRRGKHMADAVAVALFLPAED